MSSDQIITHGALLHVATLGITANTLISFVDLRSACSSDSHYLRTVVVAENAGLWPRSVTPAWAEDSSTWLGLAGSCSSSLKLLHSSVPFASLPSPFRDFTSSYCPLLTVLLDSLDVYRLIGTKEVAWPWPT